MGKAAVKVGLSDTVALTGLADPNRHLIEVPDRFAVARWSRDAEVATIASCILETLKYEPHTTTLRHALEGVIKHERAAASAQYEGNIGAEQQEPPDDED